MKFVRWARVGWGWGWLFHEFICYRFISGLAHWVRRVSEVLTYSTRARASVSGSGFPK
jgi:hypothetical protein